MIGLLVALLFTPSASPDRAEPEVRFVESSEDWGLIFDHHSGASGRFYMVETGAGGVVVLDYDGDGDDDVFFVDGGRLPGYEGPPARSALFRNDGGVRFVDATEASGLTGPGYGGGGTAGDIDGDGDVDLYLTGYGGNLLWRNEGDGTFTDITDASGTADSDWSTSATFADFDGDRDLDLYVARYVDYQVSDPVPCHSRKGRLDYCHPDAFEPSMDRLLINVDGLRFSDASVRAGVPDDGKSLGVVAVDLDGDGWLDVYVANDTTPNHVLRNRGDGTFEDASLFSGASLGENLMAEAGMGVDQSDIDRDGDADIVVTNYSLESNALYVNSGRAVFTDGRHLTGIAEPSIPKLGFGVDFADFDNDGDEDLAIANGHVLQHIEDDFPSLEYRQANQLLVHRDGRFVVEPGAGFELRRVSRALATSDLDLDGDVDLLIVNKDERAEVYANVTRDAGNWLQVGLRGRAPNTAAIGARLSLRAGSLKLTTQAIAASSFQAQNSLWRHFGLGGADLVDAVEVDWPAGSKARFEHIPAARRVVLAEAIP